MDISTSQVGGALPASAYLVLRRSVSYQTFIDERAVPPAGRIGETEDLVGSVFVKDGKVSCS